eukprot:3117669-Prymnesium_polylepis.1
MPPRPWATRVVVITRHAHAAPPAPARPPPAEGSQRRGEVRRGAGVLLYPPPPCPGMLMEWSIPMTGGGMTRATVSYTHLRAHETLMNL